MKVVGPAKLISVQVWRHCGVLVKHFMMFAAHVCWIYGCGCSYEDNSAVLAFVFKSGGRNGRPELKVMKIICFNTKLVLKLFES